MDSSGNLVEDIIEEILSRLPVKSLLRFRCVSKSWLSLISSETFIKTHSQKSTKNRAFSHRRVIIKGRKGKLTECSLHQLLHEPSSIETSPIYHPANNEVLLRATLVVGCCDGLFCLFDKRCGKFSLWNPATRIYIELPELDYFLQDDMNVGFGWDRKSGAYKVFVHGITYEGIGKLNVYSSKTNSWKTVEHKCLVMYDRVGVFACGKIHWIRSTKDDYYIETFDLESEEFGRIELPYNPPKCPRPHYFLAAIEGCLHLLCVHERQYFLAAIEECLHFLCVYERQSYVVVSVMKEESGWLELFTHSLDFELRGDPLRNLFLGGPNREVLIRLCENFIVYSPKDDVHVVRADVNISTYYHQSLVYVESLVSPNFTTNS